MRPALKSTAKAARSSHRTRKQRAVSNWLRGGQPPITVRVSTPAACRNTTGPKAQGSATSIVTAHVDIVAGPYWYAGPGFEESHEYYPATESFERRKADGSEQQVPGFEGALGVENEYTDNFIAHVYDFDEDGWQDILTLGFPGEQAAWYRNPQGGGGRWTRHVMLEPLDNESPGFVDIDGDDRPDILATSKGYVGYATRNDRDPAAAWTFHRISPHGEWDAYTHGLGAGDVNGDGRADIIEANAWWEQPASLAGDPQWTRHPVELGYGAQFHAYDVNDDGLPDIVGSIEAHGYGLAWWEQVRAAGEAISFRRHLILGTEQDDGIDGVAVFPAARGRPRGYRRRRTQGHRDGQALPRARLGRGSGCTRQAGRLLVQADTRWRGCRVRAAPHRRRIRHRRGRGHCRCERRRARGYRHGQQVRAVRAHPGVRRLLAGRRGPRDVPAGGLHGHGVRGRTGHPATDRLRDRRPRAAMGGGSLHLSRAPAGRRRNGPHPRVRGHGPGRAVRSPNGVQGPAQPGQRHRGRLRRPVGGRRAAPALHPHRRRRNATPGRRSRSHTGRLGLGRHARDAQHASRGVPTDGCTADTAFSRTATSASRARPTANGSGSTPQSGAITPSRSVSRYSRRAPAIPGATTSTHTAG